MKKTSKPLIFRASRGVSLLLGVFLTGVLLGAPVFAMEDAGEAGITPDPPAQETVVSVPPQSSAPTEPASSAPLSSAPASSAPASSESPSSAPVSSGESSSGGTTSSGWESGETGSSAISSEPGDSPESGPSSEPSGENSTTTSQASSSSSSHRDPDPKESYVEYIPPKTNGNAGHTTSAQNPIAVAPKDDKTQVLSSQNWEELLSVPSSVESEPQDVSSALAPVAMGGIFGKTPSSGGASIVLIIGIVALALGVGGVAFFIYSQFFSKRHGGEEPDEDELDETSSFSFPGDSFPQDTRPLNFEKTDRDISSFSDPSQKPAHPLYPTQPSPPKKQVEDVDWDQFFKDNQ